MATGGKAGARGGAPRRSAAGGQLSCRASERRRGGRLPTCCGDPLCHAIASAVCAAAAVALLDMHWLAGAAYIAVPGALLASSAILAFGAVLADASTRDAGGVGSGGGGWDGIGRIGGESAGGPPAEAKAAAPLAAAAVPAAPPAAAPAAPAPAEAPPPRAEGTSPATSPCATSPAITLLAVLAVSAAAAIALTAAIAPSSQFPAGHPGILDAMAACHTTEAGCGRGAIAGDGAHGRLLAPAPAITTAGVPATVSVSGSLPSDARPPARVTIVVTGPDGVHDEYTVMSTATGRFSLHASVAPPSQPGMHEYTISASYASRDFDAVVLDAGTVPFTVMVLEPDISRSKAPIGPPAWIEATEGGTRPAGFPRDATGDAGTGAGGPPPAPLPIIDGIVSFEPPLPGPSVSAGQVVSVQFAYTDGRQRESFAHVRGPAPDYEILAEPSYAGAGGTGAAANKGAYRFIVQPTWQPGEYGVVVAYGADGARDAGDATSTAGILPVNVGAGAVLHAAAAEDGTNVAAATAPPFSCISVFGRIGAGIDPAPGGGGAGAGDAGAGGDAELRHGRPGGCYAGTVRGVLGPDTLDIDGRPVTLTVSNARGGEGGRSSGSGSGEPSSSASSAAADRLRELCPAGSAALVDRDDTLAVDGREPSPTIRAGYYSTVWCLGAGGGPYDGGAPGGGRHEPVNRILMAEGLAAPDPAACLTSERRLEWAECDAYTAVEQAVGGAVSAAIDAVASAATAAGGGGEGELDGNAEGGGGGGGDCAIATAAYGTPVAADVQSLREWRDLAILDAGSGGDDDDIAAAPPGPAPAVLDSALAAYYAVSPAIADMLRDNPPARIAAASVLSVPAAIAAAVADAGTAATFHSALRGAA